MKETNESPLSGLESLYGELSGATIVPKETHVVGEDDDDIDQPLVNQEGDDDDVAIADDDTVIDENQDVNGDDEDVAARQDDNATDDIPAGESDNVGLFFDVLAEAFDWGDVSSEDKPKTIEDFIDKVKANIGDSGSSFASEEVKELNDYISNGGQFEDYFAVNSQQFELDSLDIEQEDNQKQVLKRFLELNGYSNQQIAKKIAKYEDAGLLEDEATDALEFLKEETKAQKEAMLQAQAVAKQEYEQQQVQFITSVKSDVEKLSAIRGVNIPQADKKQLVDYIFKVEADGKTRYQKDYAKNLTKNLIESAYFTMKGDALIKSAENKGQTSAAKRLRDAMRTTKISSKGDMDNRSPVPVWAASNLKTR